MRKYALFLLLLLPLCLTACGAAEEGATYSITDELTQRYELPDLRWQEGLFRAIAQPDDNFEVTAGLQAGTGRLITAYAHASGDTFWLECHTLTATEQAVARERAIPLGIWLTNPETPAHQAELLLESSSGTLYAVYLCSDTKTEEKLLRTACSVYVWLPGEADPITVSCTGETAQPLGGQIPWTQSGDGWPGTGEGRLSLRVETRETDLVSAGTWRLQRLNGGRWHDMDQCGEGLDCDGSSVWGSVELQLPAGKYRLMLSAASEHGKFTEIPYYFIAAEESP